MLKRVVAWILLVGFVFLILNILLFKTYRELSAMIYVVVVLCFLLFLNKKNKK